MDACVIIVFHRQERTTSVFHYSVQFVISEPLSIISFGHDVISRHFSHMKSLLPVLQPMSERTIALAIIHHAVDDWLRWLTLETAFNKGRVSSSLLLWKATCWMRLEELRKSPPTSRQVARHRRKTTSRTDRFTLLAKIDPLSRENVCRSACCLVLKSSAGEDGENSVKRPVNHLIDSVPSRKVDESVVPNGEVTKHKF